MSAVGSYIFIYGGLKGSTLLDDFLLAEDGGGSQLSICDPRSPTWSVTSRASLCHAAISTIACTAHSLASYCRSQHTIDGTSAFIVTRSLMFVSHALSCCASALELLCQKLLGSTHDTNITPTMQFQALYSEYPLNKSTQPNTNRNG